jgi:hypothetical protein
MTLSRWHAVADWQYCTRNGMSSGHCPLPEFITTKATDPVVSATYMCGRTLRSVHKRPGGNPMAHGRSPFVGWSGPAPPGWNQEVKPAPAPSRCRWSPGSAAALRHSGAGGRLLSTARRHLRPIARTARGTAATCSDSPPAQPPGPAPPVPWPRCPWRAGHAATRGTQPSKGGFAISCRARGVVCLRLSGS